MGKSKNVLADGPPFLSNETLASSNFPKGNVAYLGWKEVTSRCQPRDSAVLLSVLCAVLSRWFLPCSPHGSSHAMCAVWTGRTSSFFPAPHASLLLWNYCELTALCWHLLFLIVTWQHCPADPSICWTAQALSSHAWYSTRGTSFASVPAHTFSDWYDSAFLPS